jgi:hypothetical protein
MPASAQTADMNRPCCLALRLMSATGFMPWILCAMSQKNHTKKIVAGLSDQVL